MPRLYLMHGGARLCTHCYQKQRDFSYLSVDSVEDREVCSLCGDMFANDLDEWVSPTNIQHMAMAVGEQVDDQPD